MKQKNNPKSQIGLSPYISAISVRFRPANSSAEATHRFTTAEVKAAIKELNPALNVTDTQVVDAMTEAGYIFFTPRGSQSLRFQWLLIEK